MPRSPWSAAAVVAASVLLVAACTGGGADVPPRPTTAAPPTTASPDPTNASPTPTPEPDQPIAYVPWGPADPVVPQHYGDLARRDCAAAQDSAPTDAFWEAVVAVCRSLTQDQPWPDLTEVPAVPETQDPHEQCLNAELATMVSDALAWRDTHPDAEPTVAFAETGSRCYLAVYGGRQVPAAEDATAPSPGQITVAVIVDSTWDVAAAEVNGTAVPEGALLVSDRDPFDGVATVSIHVPAPAEVGTLRIDIEMTQAGDPRGTVSTSVDVAPPEAPSSPSPDTLPGLPVVDALGPIDADGS